MPSPYQVELFNCLSSRNKIDLHVVYSHIRSKGRMWSMSNLTHSHEVLDEKKLYESAKLRMAELSIFSNYTNSSVRSHMRATAANKRPWCYWGERPGFRSTGFVGKWYRRSMLYPLYQDSVPIWGVGEWAIRGYQREFGARRLMLNVPYTSNLSRFANVAKERLADQKPFRFLFSGSFIFRKGVDVLAKSFVKLIRSGIECELVLLGDGPMRKKLAHRLEKVQNRVCYLGFKQWEELPVIYADADALCVPSRYDGWALVVPEGLAAGLPVIASDCTGAALDLIRCGENGNIYPAYSLGGLYAAMLHVATAPSETLCRMRKNAQKVVATHGLEAGAERFEQAVHATLSWWSRHR